MFTETKYNAYSLSAKFLQTANLDELAHQLYRPKSVVLEILMDTDLHYRKFSIPKKKGGYRMIEAPTLNLGEIQMRLNRLLQPLYYRMRPECVHGFISGIENHDPAFSIVSNARPHVGAGFVLNVDMEDFFHSVSIYQVKRVFMSYPFYFKSELASFLALLTTNQERLPMGAPTSPVLSNLACFLFDRRMMRFAEEQELTYTRYADDLTFSSNKRIRETTIDAIRAIVKEYRFDVHDKKTRLLTNKGSQVVTGLKVNEKVNVDRKFVRNIRAMLSNWGTHGLERAAMQNKSWVEFQNILKGKLDFLSMVRGKKDPVFLKLYDKFRILEAQSA